MRIPCPVCGLRDLAEFSYGGDASVTRPAHDETDAEVWYRYVYERRNPAGRHEEYWQHLHGCRSWLVLTRDTRTHAIEGSSLAGAWRPGAQNAQNAQNAMPGDDEAAPEAPGEPARAA